MGAYILRRILLMIPTLIGIMLINFVVVQIAPGGPVEQAIARLTGQGGSSMQQVTQGGGDIILSGDTGARSGYRGAQGLDPQFIADLEKRFGFDKPLHERFLLMMGNYVRFDFGTSFFSGKRVVDAVAEKLPVSTTARNTCS